MAHNRNLKYQFNNIINQIFKEGMDKHSLKFNGLEKNCKIFSYSDRKNLIDLSCNFSNFMKENHNEIKLLKDIQPKHIQEFLESKRADCSTQTLKQYASHFRKLETLTQNTYQVNVDYHSVIIPPSLKNGGGKIRTDMLSADNYNKMLCTTNENLKRALILSQNFGLRCSEISKLQYKDIKADGIHVVDSKGKRSRVIPIETDKQKELLKQFRGQGRVCPIQKGSLQQAFNRQKQRVGITSASDFHSCRKTYATECYQRYRKEGQSVQQALDKTSKNLGHNENRNILMRQYILCPIV